MTSWIVFEVATVAFFVLGYVLYRRNKRNGSGDSE